MREQFAAYLQYLPSARAYLKETGIHLEDRCLLIEYPLTAYQFNGTKVIHKICLSSLFANFFCVVDAVKTADDARRAGLSSRPREASGEISAQGGRAYAWEGGSRYSVRSPFLRYKNA